MNDVHVCLPVLDPAPVVTGDKPVLVVGEIHAANGAVVSLKHTHVDEDGGKRDWKYSM